VKNWVPAARTEQTEAPRDVEVAVEPQVMARYVTAYHEAENTQQKILGEGVTVPRGSPKANLWKILGDYS
jgi:mannitol/fructose-specific phosphotransferase system IIA component